MSDVANRQKRPRRYEELLDEEGKVRPAWKPLYADRSTRMESWSKFVSEAYWNVTLKE